MLRLYLRFLDYVCPSILPLSRRILLIILPYISSSWPSPLPSQSLSFPLLHVAFLSTSYTKYVLFPSPLPKPPPYRIEANDPSTDALPIDDLIDPPPVSFPLRPRTHYAHAHIHMNIYMYTEIEMLWGYAAHAISSM